jgi:BirA family transcriptional regulator, biotin operon repressor / biotin---[acetyl-CoA-carboxylase] ligase
MHEAGRTATDAAWGVAALQAALCGVWPGAQVQVLAETDSTNTQLLQRARAGGLHAPTLLVAERQTQGRGRLGRAWHSRAGDSLTFSLALPYAPRQWDGLSLAVGAALAEALEPGAEPPRLRLKWPNDLWLGTPGVPGGRKLGGILIETVAAGAARVVVVGIGLNLAEQPPLPGAEALAHGHAGLRELLPGLQAAQALQRVAVPLAHALETFATQGLAPWAAAYARRDLLAGQPVRTLGEPALAGVAEGVGADGALQLRLPNGTRHRVASGEVSVRLQAVAEGA